MIRAVVVEDEPVTARHLATLLADTWQVDVVGIATNGQEGLRLCLELHPNAVFVDINLPEQQGMSLAAQLTALPGSPRLVFIAASSDSAPDAFRLQAVDYLLKPLSRLQVAEAIYRLLAFLRPLEFGSFYGSVSCGGGILAPKKLPLTSTASELLPVKDLDRDQIRLLARHEIVSVQRRKRRTWIHTVLEEFSTYYSLADLIHWLGGDPFIQLGRDAVVNLRAVEKVSRSGPRIYRVKVRDRLGSEIRASRAGAARLTATLKDRR
jgi:two-component system, LytTR family, response regulator LytT